MRPGKLFWSPAACQLGQHTNFWVGPNSLKHDQVILRCLFHLNLLKFAMLKSLSQKKCPCVLLCFWGGGVEAQEDVYRQCSFSAATLGSEQDWPVVGKHMPCGKGILVFYDNAHYMIIWSDKWSNGTIGQDWKEVQVVEFRNSGIEIKQL